MKVSDELLALQEAEAIIQEHKMALYVGEGILMRLPRDGTASAAFGVLVGAQDYIQRRIREHVRGRRDE